MKIKNIELGNVTFCVTFPFFISVDSFILNIYHPQKQGVILWTNTRKMGFYLSEIK